MPSAGEIIRAADVARTIHVGQCSTATNITSTTLVDITGATVTFTTSRDNVECVVNMTADVFRTTVGYGNAFIELIVDGVTQSGGAIVGDGNVRDTVGQTFSVTLASAGSHTIKMSGNVTTASGACTVQPLRTRFVATVYDVTS